MGRGPGVWPPETLDSVVGVVVAKYIIVVVALATAISLLAQQISSIRFKGDG